MAPTRLVVGLGNPGDEYRATRHNLGFLAVEKLARVVGAAVSSGAFSGPVREECRSRVVELSETLFCQPLTYMNRSGAAVRCLLERYEISPADTLVVYDELHLPLGRIRLKSSGSPAGHRGMESIVEALGTEAVPRLRLGIGPVPAGAGDAGLADFVLAPFLPQEAASVERMIDRAAEAARVWITSGIESAMNRANQADLPATPPAG